MCHPYQHFEDRRGVSKTEAARTPKENSDFLQGYIRKNGTENGKYGSVIVHPSQISYLIEIMISHKDTFSQHVRLMIEGIIKSADSVNNFKLEGSVPSEEDIKNFNALIADFKIELFIFVGFVRTSSKPNDNELFNGLVTYLQNLQNLQNQEKLDELKSRLKKIQESQKF